MFKRFTFLSIALLIGFSGVVNAESLSEESLSSVCQALSNGGQMVNLTDDAEFMFLTDSEGVVHERFLANGKDVQFGKIGEQVKTMIFDGLKYNYDVIACVSPQGNIVNSIGIIKSDN